MRQPQFERLLVNFVIDGEVQNSAFGNIKFVFVTDQ